MKRIFLTGSMIVFSCSYSFAFLGAIQDTAHNAKVVAYQAFMKAKIVKQIQILTKNYKDSRDFYDYMKRISGHSGGIPGYMKDEITESMRRSDEDIYWQFRNDIQTAPDDKRYIYNYIKGADKAASDRIREAGKSIENKIHYLETVHKRGKKRDEDIEDFSDKASKDKLDENKRKELDIIHKALSLETLSSIDRNIRQLLKMNVEQEQERYQSREDEIVERMKFYESIDNMISQYRTQKPKKDAYKVLKETPMIER
ncbi:MAG: hypothetical protein ABIH89_02370 [Elusimicrobiota bacterium]